MGKDRSQNESTAPPAPVEQIISPPEILPVSLAIITRDEERYLPRLLQTVVGKVDEIVVVDDESKDKTRDIATQFGARVEVRPLSEDFAAQRNYAAGLCKHTWVLMLDADEIPSGPLIHGIRRIAANLQNTKVDVAGIPRLNFIEHRLVPSPGYQGLDFQYRLYRRDSCQWASTVHEELQGAGPRVELHLAEGHFILHKKDIQKHITRNLFYDKLAQKAKETRSTWHWQDQLSAASLSSETASS